MIPVELAHRSVAQLEAAGAEVLYRESPIDHAIDPAFVAELRPWLGGVTASARRSVSVSPCSRDLLEAVREVALGLARRPGCTETESAA